MSVRTKRFFALPFLFASLSISLFTQAAQNSGADCDRECLTLFLDLYLEAMIDNNPSSLALADNLRFTEDTVEMQLGEGLWEHASSLTDYRMDILDVRNSTAISHLVVEESGTRVMFALRLKIANGEISEVETMVVRNQEEGMIFNIDALQEVSEGMLAFPDSSVLNSRQEMIDMAVLYPEGLKTGSFVKVDVPFRSDTYRFENGNLMAGPGCTFFEGCADIKSQGLPTLAGLTYKVGAVDEELGIVLLRMNFGPGSTFNGEDVLNVWEAFKVYDGEIHAVEAFMEVLPMGTASGWEGL